MSNFQSLDFYDLLAKAAGTGKPVVMPDAEVKGEYIFGLIKEIKPGEVRAPGTRFQPPPYTFVDGKRVANRSQRFSGR